MLNFPACMLNFEEPALWNVHETCARRRHKLC